MQMYVRNVKLILPRETGQSLFPRLTMHQLRSETLCGGRRISGIYVKTIVWIENRYYSFHTLTKRLMVLTLCVIDSSWSANIACHHHIVGNSRTL